MRGAGYVRRNAGPPGMFTFSFLGPVTDVTGAPRGRPGCRQYCGGYSDGRQTRTAACHIGQAQRDHRGLDRTEKRRVRESLADARGQLWRHRLGHRPRKAGRPGNRLCPRTPRRTQPGRPSQNPATPAGGRMTTPCCLAARFAEVAAGAAGTQGSGQSSGCGCRSLEHAFPLCLLPTRPPTFQ